MNIQWYPGHMTKAKRAMKEDIKLIDLIIELVDARVPLSSRNPDIDDLGAGKARLILLNKSDLADERCNLKWAAYFQDKGYYVVKVNSKSGAGLKAINGVVQEACKEKIERDRRRGILNRPVRAMVVGIPNVGKSSFINRLAGGGRAKVEDRPGVTRGNQWFKVADDLDLLDTPGVLWPKFDDPSVGERLAFTGAIKDQVVDTETLAAALLAFLGKNYAGLLADRYGFQAAAIPLEEDDTLLLDETGGTAGKDIRWGFALLTELGRRRRMFAGGGQIDTDRAAAILLDEFRSGRLGRISLERP